MLLLKAHAESRFVLRVQLKLDTLLKEVYAGRRSDVQSCQSEGESVQVPNNDNERPSQHARIRISGPVTMRTVLCRRACEKESQKPTEAQASTNGRPLGEQQR